MAHFWQELIRFFSNSTPALIIDKYIYIYIYIYIDIIAIIHKGTKKDI